MKPYPRRSPGRGIMGLCAGLLMLSACRPADAPPPASPLLSAPLTHYIPAGRAPTTALDPRTGVTYIAWFERSGQGANVMLARHQPGASSLSTPVRVNHLEGDATIHAQAPAQVRVGPDGAVYVLWTNRVPSEGRIFPASDLRFARSTDGGRTFSPALTVNSDAGGRPSSHTFHDLTVGPDGTIYVAWLDGRTRDAARARLMAEGKLKPPATGGHGKHDRAAMAAAARAEAQLPLPGTELRVAVSRDGGRSFEETAVVAEGTCQCCRTALAVGEDGTLYLAWRHIFPGGERDIALVRSIDGARTFTSPTRVHADGWQLDGCPHAGPSLALDARGQVHVAWYTGAPSRPGLYYAFSKDGGRSFSAPVPLADGVGVSQVKLGGHDTDRIWLAWENGRSLYLAVANGAGGVTVTDTLSGSQPALAAGNGLVALAGQTESDAFVRLLPAP